MTKSVVGMHAAAMEAAIKRGPRLMDIAVGHSVAAYGLDYDELDRLFTTAGYNTDRRSWRTIIAKWGKDSMWGDIVPREKILLDGESTEWSVMFMTMAPQDYAKLCRFARENNVDVLPAEIDYLPGLEPCRPVVSV